jgi:hypothetical protein
VNITNYLQLVLTLRARGALLQLPLYAFMELCLVRVKTAFLISKEIVWLRKVSFQKEEFSESIRSENIIIRKCTYFMQLLFLASLASDTCEIRGMTRI